MPRGSQILEEVLRESARTGQRAYSEAMGREPSRTFQRLGLPSVPEAQAMFGQIQERGRRGEMLFPEEMVIEDPQYPGFMGKLGRVAGALQGGVFGAAYGAIEEEESILGGAWKGFTGQRIVRARYFLEELEEALDMEIPRRTKIALGWTGDIFIDPLWLIGGPLGLTKTGRATKLVSQMRAVQKTGKPITMTRKLQKALDLVGPFAKTGGTLEEQARLGQRALFTLGLRGHEVAAVPTRTSVTGFRQFTKVGKAVGKTRAAQDTLRAFGITTNPAFNDWMSDLRFRELFHKRDIGHITRRWDKIVTENNLTYDQLRQVTKLLEMPAETAENVIEGMVKKLSLPQRQLFNEGSGLYDLLFKWQVGGESGVKLRYYGDSMRGILRVLEAKAEGEQLRVVKEVMAKFDTAQKLLDKELLGGHKAATTAAKASKLGHALRTAKNKRGAVRAARTREEKRWLTQGPPNELIEEQARALAQDYAEDYAGRQARSIVNQIKNEVGGLKFEKGYEEYWPRIPLTLKGVRRQFTEKSILKTGRKPTLADLQRAIAEGVGAGGTPLSEAAGILHEKGIIRGPWVEDLVEAIETGERVGARTRHWSNYVEQATTMIEDAGFAPTPKLAERLAKAEDVVAAAQKTLDLDIAQRSSKVTERVAKKMVKEIAKRKGRLDKIALAQPTGKKLYKGLSAKDIEPMQKLLEEMPSYVPHVEAPLGRALHRAGISAGAEEMIGKRNARLISDKFDNMLQRQWHDSVENINRDMLRFAQENYPHLVEKLKRRNVWELLHGKEADPRRLEFFHSDPRAIVGAYGWDASAAKTAAEFLDGAIGEGPRMGKAAFGARIAEVPDEIAKGTWMTVTPQRLEGWAFPRDVAKMIDRHHSFLSNMREVKGALKIWDESIGFLRGVALLAPSYHVRNVGGGNFLHGFVHGGTRNPKRYREAMSMVSHSMGGRFARNAMPLEKMKWVTAAGETVTGGEMLRLANRYGVFDQSLFATAVPRGSWVARAPGLKQNRQTGIFLENWSRMAHFIDRVVKGDEPFKAGRSVAKYFFNYPELGQLEREVGRRLVFFYAWPRNNFILHARRLLERPGIDLKVAQMIRQSQSSPLAAPEELVPEWIKEQIGVPVKKTKDGKHMYWMLANWIPEAEIYRLAETFTREGVNNGVAKVFGGYVVPPIRWAIEQMTNKQLYFDRAIQEFPGDSISFMGVHMDKRLAYFLNEVRFLNEIDRMNPNNVFGEGRFGKTELVPGTKLPTLLIGRQYPVDVGKEQRRVYYQKMSDMEDIDKAIRSAARKGDEEAWLRFVQVKREYIEREFK